MNSVQHIPDTTKKVPFVAVTLDNWVCKQAVISFTDDFNNTPGYNGNPVNGTPYAFSSDPDIEKAHIRAISLYMLSGVFAPIDDVKAWNVGSRWYNIPTYAQVADWYLVLKNKKGDQLFAAMPLTRLSYFSGLQADCGKLLAVDFTDISLTDSFIRKRGSQPLPTLPFSFVFQFHYDP